MVLVSPSLFLASDACLKLDSTCAEPDAKFHTCNIYPHKVCIDTAFTYAMANDVSSS